MSITIHSNILTNSDCYNKRRTIKPSGIMVHSTATPGAMAKNFISSWNRPGVGACVHAFVDNTGVYQTLPWNWRAWHCGAGRKGSANNTHISFEICEPSGFYYKNNRMTNYNIQEQQAYFNSVYNNAVELCAFLCKKYGLTEKNIICHSEGCQLGIATNHADVMHWFPKHGKNMDIFREDVRKLLNGNMNINQNITANSSCDIYKITTSVLNARSGPSTSYPIVGQYTMNNYIEVVVVNNNWARLKNNTYVSTNYISLYRKANQVKASPWAQDSWNKAVMKGVFDGTNPQGALTREQAAVILSRLNLI